MDELMIIVSEKNDVVYKHIYNRSSDEEYCKLVVLVYGSIDTLLDKMASTNSNYFDRLDTYGDRTVSAYVMPSGYKILFIHHRKSPRSFLNDVHRLFAAVLLARPLDNKIMDDRVLDSEMAAVYSRHFQPRVD